MTLESDRSSAGRLKLFLREPTNFSNLQLERTQSSKGRYMLQALTATSQANTNEEGAKSGNSYFLVESQGFIENSYWKLSRINVHARSELNT